MAYKLGSNLNTYTPTLTGSVSNPTPTFSTLNGTYEQIGDVVFIKVGITLSAISGGSGDARISLPFTSKSDSINTVGCVDMQNVTFPASTIYFTAYVAPNTAYAVINANLTSGANSTLQISGLSSTGNIRFNLMLWI